MAAPIAEQILSNVHEGLLHVSSDINTIEGSFLYYHYGCDTFDDRGWGCGYRTLQSLCSWVKNQQEETALDKSHKVPTIPEIQTALVAMQDKPANFIGSRDWIGSFEVPCKILHVNSGKDLPNHLEELTRYFQEFRAPVMMGGESDSSSKGVLGVCREPPALLIMDPHYYGPVKSKENLQREGWVKWRLIKDFEDHSFYNLCLPQLKCRDNT